MKCERDSFEAPFTFQLTPFTDGDSDTVILLSASPDTPGKVIDLRCVPLLLICGLPSFFVDKSFVGCIYTFPLTLNRLLGNSSNAGVSSFSTRSSEQTSHDSSHTVIRLYIADAATNGNTYALHAYRPTGDPSIYFSGVCVSHIYWFALAFTHHTFNPCSVGRQTHNQAILLNNV